MSRLFDLSSSYVDRSAALDPFLATAIGIAGGEEDVTDLSPDGLEARIQLARQTIDEISAEPAADSADRLAGDVLKERLGVTIDLHDRGEDLCALRPIGSPVQQLRQIFDLMPTESETDWVHVTRRMLKISQGVTGLIATLKLGLDRGMVAARRQAEVCAEQCRVWSGGSSGSGSYFSGLADRYEARPAANPALLSDLRTGAVQASAAYADLERFLASEYAPRAPAHDGVGPERHAAWRRAVLGADVDARQTYEWGWEELQRIESAMAAISERIQPGCSTGAVIEALEADPELAIEGEDRLLGWLQDLMDRTIAALDGVAFDIPAPLRTVQAMIAPPGGAAAMYYTAPSEDFSRPGRTWYPTLGKTRFPLWGEVSIAYHEGVPGHHLQLGTVMYQSETLSRFQRTMAFCSGHAEGWALYAERLMGELGFFEGAPHYELGMLRAQALRAARVVVDLGLHLGFPPPTGVPATEWTYDSALAFVLAHGWFPPDFLASEVTRYLGWPAQAICYKVGERAWLQARDRARQADPGFDLRDWHRSALAIGNVGLDQLDRELSRLLPQTG
jgi:uncharacterized protein (DUF885 family)